MIPRLLLAGLALGLLTGQAPPPRSPNAVIAAAPPSAWREVAPDRLMLLTLAGDRRVIIELAPDFAPAHVANLRRLLAARWFDGAAVVRVQDNYVVQWGDPGEKPLPAGAAATITPEWERASAGLAFDPIPGPDGYGEPGFVDGWPAARNPATGRSWLVHCYGAVGVGRGEDPSSGNAGELYAVIGHAPRNLDRNYTVIGRVVEGIEQLSSLPRGTGPLGFHAEPRQRVPVLSARLASDLPAEQRPRIEVLKSGTPTFAEYVRLRASRADFINPHGFVDLCNVRPPARQVTP